MTVARQGGRYGHRDATAILVAFRHGLRSSELVDLQWDQIDLVQKTIRINRVKNGTGATHYLSNSELRALRRLQRENPPGPHRDLPAAIPSLDRAKFCGFLSGATRAWPLGRGRNDAQ
jgi:integrase